MIKPIIVIQGLQYGSEAKGMVASALGLRKKVEVAVRTGSINAGHTVYYTNPKTGRETVHKMQQLPVGWTNPNTELVIGAGAYIHMPTLRREIAEINLAVGDGSNVMDRLRIDQNCGVHLDEHQKQAGIYNRHESMGATGKGCAEATISKIVSRGIDPEAPLFRSMAAEFGTSIVDTVSFLNWSYDKGRQILIEGTQGTLLDLHHGPYPYVTSRMTSSANWLAEAGLSPALRYDIVGVVRTMPIRVAGNSGPLPLETSWSQLMYGWNKRHPVIEEKYVREFHRAWVDTQASLGIPREPETLNITQRYQYRRELSQLPSMAMDTLRSRNEAAHDEVSKIVEMTTVTKKLRRIASEFLTDDLMRAIKIERPNKIALTFLNYVFPELWNKTDLSGNPSIEVANFLGQVDTDLGVDVRYFTTGPRDGNFF